MTMRSGRKFALYSAIGAFALVATSLSLSGTVKAATSPCPTPVFANNVVTNSGCQFTTDGAKDNGTTASRTTLINSEGFFSGGWTWAGSSDISGLTTTGVGGTTGSWTLPANFFSLFGQALLTFTDGSSQVSPDGIVGYLITAANGLTGTWTSPFTNPQSPTSLKNISIINLYGGGEPANPPGAVPLPGAIWLLLSALGSLGVFSWWRRRGSVLA